MIYYIYIRYICIYSYHIYIYIYIHYLSTSGQPRQGRDKHRAALGPARAKMAVLDPKWLCLGKESYTAYQAPVKARQTQAEPTIPPWLGKLPRRVDFIIVGCTQRARTVITRTMTTQACDKLDTSSRVRRRGSGVIVQGMSAVAGTQGPAAVAETYSGMKRRHRRSDAPACTSTLLCKNKRLRADNLLNYLCIPVAAGWVPLPSYLASGRSAGSRQSDALTLS
jgi:hypothetical protein